MPAITFRAKIETLYDLDGAPTDRRLKVPKLAAQHCDMGAFRTHPRHRSLANSAMFPGYLAREVAKLGVKSGGWLYLRFLPDGVSVDETGFLAKVVIDVP